jgi:hypothetical protein
LGRARPTVENPIDLPIGAFQSAARLRSRIGSNVDVHGVAPWMGLALRAATAFVG